MHIDAPNLCFHDGEGAAFTVRPSSISLLNCFFNAARLEPATAERQADLGEAYTASGDPGAAFRAYQQATVLAPKNATYWSLLALFCADHDVQVLEVGLPAARKAEQLSPNDPQVLDSLGWSLAQAGELSDAVPTLLKATLLDPGSAAAHFHLAQTYLLQGDQKSAGVELQLAFQLDAGGPVGESAWQLLQRNP